MQPNIIVLVLGTVVAGIDVETGEAVDGRRAEEVLAHPGRAAGRDAAAAFDAAVKLENLLGKLVFHALFFGAGIERLVLRVNPRFDFAAHFTEPHARIHGQVAKQLEDRQGMQDDVIGQIPGLGMAGEAGTPVDDHAAGTADARATAEVELEARILLLTDDVQRDEQGHGAVFFHIKRLHVRNGGGIKRIVPEHLDMQFATHSNSRI